MPSENDTSFFNEAGPTGLGIRGGEEEMSVECDASWERRSCMAARIRFLFVRYMMIFGLKRAFNFGLASAPVALSVGAIPTKLPWMGGMDDF